jgi:peptide-methionine (S)-S-oxide reductase
MKRRSPNLVAALLALCATLTVTAQPVKTEPTDSAQPASTDKSATQKIVVGGGCFWCVEAVYQRLPGVKKVISGYSGGHVKNPTYEQICTKTTGHAEVVEVEFDPKVASLENVLDVFFAAHDPTTKDRQGNDVGPQYRSVIYYADDEQKKAAEAAVKRNQKEWKDPIVTEVGPLKNWYPAEDYHQNYFNQNANKNPYCSYVIVPKLRKLVEKGVIKPVPVE